MLIAMLFQTPTMTEQLNVNGKDVWVVIEPLTVQRESEDQTPTEYFIVFYHMQEPGTETGVMFREDDHRPLLFESPVAALQYAQEKLIEIL